MIYQRIKTLCKQSGDTITGLESKLGFAKGSLSKIDSHKPSSERIGKLAYYFNVSPTFILTGNESLDTDTEFVARNEHEKKVLISYRGAGMLDEDARDDLDEMIASTVDMFLKARGIKKK